MKFTSGKDQALLDQALKTRIDRMAADDAAKAQDPAGFKAAKKAAYRAAAKKLQDR